MHAEHVRTLVNRRTNLNANAFSVKSPYFGMKDLAFARA